MADILIGQAYYLRFDAKLWEAMQPYPPLGALYAASVLRSRGHDAALFDAMLAESTDEWTAALDGAAPRIAVIYEDSFNYLSKMCLLRMREAAFTMLAAARARGCITIVSSSDSTDHREAYFQAGADFIIVGEGEFALADLVGVLLAPDGARTPSIAGVVSRGAPPDALTPRAATRALDELPFPAWDLVDVERYRRIWIDAHGYYSVNAVGARGCPYHCNWCAKPIYGQRYNARSPEDVVAEIARLRREVRPDHIWFADDLFGLKPGWIERFSALVVESGVRTPFKCLLRTDQVTAPVAEALRAAGCDTVWMGVESGSQRILDAMEKGATVDDTRRATMLLHRAGVKVGYFIQFGYPGEGWSDIRQTLRLIREGQPDDLGVSVAYPLPGTTFHERVRADLGVQHNWLDSNDLAMLYRGPFSTAFYRRLHACVHREYRARKAWRQLWAGRPSALLPIVRAARLPLDYLDLLRLGRVSNASSSA